METAPAAALVVIEPDLVLELLEVALDAPADFHEADELVERDRGRHRRQPVLRGRRLAPRPLHEQPFDGTCHRASARAATCWPAAARRAPRWRAAGGGRSAGGGAGGAPTRTTAPARVALGPVAKRSCPLARPRRRTARAPARRRGTPPHSHSPHPPRPAPAAPQRRADDPPPPARSPTSGQTAPSPARGPPAAAGGRGPTPRADRADRHTGR